jgi:uncharacterized protein (DUF433 family)
MESENKIDKLIIMTPGTCGGKPRIAGRRIRVQDIAVWHEHFGMSPERIIAEYPGLTLSDVQGALDYFYNHRQEIMNDILEEEGLAEEMQLMHPSRIRGQRAGRHADPLSSG